MTVPPPWLAVHTGGQGHARLSCGEHPLLPQSPSDLRLRAPTPAPAPTRVWEGSEARLKGRCLMPRGRAGTTEGVAAPHPRLGSIAKCSCRAGEGALVPSCASLCGPAHFCICTEVRWPGSASASAVTDGPAQGLEGCLALAEGAACPGASGGHLALRQPTPGACVRGSRCGRHAHAARSKGCSHGRGFSPARV